FSSRRRHTRCLSDWSSDVCSSDLARIGRDIPGATISLGKLDHEALGRLVQWALPSYSGDAANRLARRIAADSAGLPLLAVEICHAMAQGLNLEATNGAWPHPLRTRSEEHTSELQSLMHLVCRLLLGK